MIKIILPSVISATVAVLIFCFTQYLSYRRNRSDFLQTKIEELFVSFDVMINAARILSPRDHKDGLSAPDLIVMKAQDLADSLQVPYMLTFLYFEDAIPFYRNVATALKQMNRVMHECAGNLKMLEGEEIPSAFAELQDHVTLMKNYIIENQGKLTKSLVLVSSKK